MTHERLKRDEKIVFGIRENGESESGKTVSLESERGTAHLRTT